MTRSPEPPNLEHYEKIARFLHTVLLKTQQQRVDLLTEAGRAWLQATSAEAQIAKLTARLEQQPTQPVLTVERILVKLFVSAFQGSRPYGQIVQRVQQLALAIPKQSPAHPTQDEPSNLSWVGLLLVDAENMNPPEALEAFLQTVGRYPIRHRLAFGNWRKLGRRDRDLYRRGYQMVHVPSGKNSADIKMAVDTSLITLQNPLIREVFICSTDTDLLHLGYALLNLGVSVHCVGHRHDGWFEVLNLAQQTTQKVYFDSGEGADPTAESTQQVMKVPTLAETARSLKQLLAQAHQDDPDQPVTMGRLGKLFRDRHHLSASEALQANSGYKTLGQFLKSHTAFVLSPLPNSKQIAVTLKASANDNTPPLPESAILIAVPQSVESLGSEGAVEAALPPPITDAHSLEQALITLLWRLSSGQTDSQIQLSVLAAYFAHVYQEPMSAALKRIGEPKGLPKFLGKCRSLKVQQQGQDWRIALACVS
ncbi:MULTISPECIES: NYN domain-containing protein [Cyanophyceae]|uniref:NYN domain-containing protein n=1 Tax=Cyanophyceae TaxID=3028117 RepID=UPI001682EB42|nr:MULTISPECIES: NYN domain-containing protein [Cyanophyceae]MBD1917583.1 NYN domain-containing protein [Phormidium sp. FACHB-77]MBD2029542.1 NYN domain-containing protein [Phormidium sp. FACHB-322]MBD2050803.1 NYN domain-containing protein [Leptolyngbya sp. FACHB-60]